MKKNLKALLSVVLTTAILLTQATVFAVPLTASIEKIPVSDVFVMAEDVSKRGEFEKHYLCSDGTFIVASYAEAIHYKNENGEWVDVDNEVSYNKSTQSYRAGNETFGVEFASASNTSRLVTMSSGDHVISWGLTTDKSISSQTSVKSSTASSISAEEVIMPSVTLKNAPVSAQNSKSLVTDSKTFELSKASGGIAYEKIIAGSPEISVDYSVYRNKIEEDIYINSKTDVKSISMNLSVGTLVAHLNFDNSVSLLNDEGEPEYTVGVPYMEDAAGEILNDIKVAVTQNGSNCVITYTPNEAWLSSEERVYPILLDPSITSSEYSSNIVDTYIYEGNILNHSSERKNLVGINNARVHRTLIKITNLPNIDPSMPIISATLTLTLPVGSTTGRTVALYKLNSDWNPSTVTYANQPSFTEADKIGTCPFNETIVSTRKFVFDLTADFAKMCNEFIAGVNYGYVLKYDDESKTNPDYNATYGMEQTTVAYRPLFTVSYGYSLPSGLAVGGVYALQNRGSYGFLTVHNGTDANDVNVYLKNANVEALGLNQQFKLEYVSSTGAYRFRAMSSSDSNGRVLDIVKSGGYVNDGGNVQIYNPTDPLANEWFIIGTGTTAFKIVPRTNMSLSLTACAGLDGTANGTTPTSAGNVFVATTAENNTFQQWSIIDMSTGESIDGGGNGFSVQNGVYYFNNRAHGKYLYRSPGVEYANGQSGLISDLGNKIRWVVNCVFDEKYTISSADDPTLYIVPGGENNRVMLDTLPENGTIPDEYLWKISTADGGGVKIQNVETLEFLYSNEATNHLGPLPSTSLASYDSYVWRMANVNAYGNTSEHSYREVTDDFYICNITMAVGDKSNLPTSERLNYLWVGVNDFTFTMSRNNAVTTNATGFTAEKRGNITIQATHKATGNISNFEIFVENSFTSSDDFDSIINDFWQLEGYGYANLGGYNIYTVYEAISEVLRYDEYITIYSNMCRIPKEFVQSVLFREIWCYSIEDAAGDVLVQEYYAWKEGNGTKPLLEKTDSSTGLAQIFSSTAIKAINNGIDRGVVNSTRKYDATIWTDVWEVWQNLHDPSNLYNLQCCTLVILDCQYEYDDELSYERFFDFTEDEIKTILSRYNGYGSAAAEYGDICYNYYLIFEAHNS